MHKQVAIDHGFTAIAPVDIMDEDGCISLPFVKGKHIKENFVEPSTYNLLRSPWQQCFFIRIVSSFTCGILAGFMVRYFYQGKQFFNFSGFEERASRDTDPNIHNHF